jgi:hypothetical protein
MYIFRHVTQFIPTWTMKQLYYKRIYPHLINTITIWGTEDRSNSYVAPLHLKHEKLIRIICHTSPTAHTAPLYKRLKILTVYSLYILRVCAELHPYIHHLPPKTGQNIPTTTNQAPNSLNTKLDTRSRLNSTSANTQNHMKLATPPSGTDYQPRSH